MLTGDPAFLMLGPMRTSNVQRIDFSALRAGSSEGHATATGILMTSGCAEVALERRFSVCAGDLYVIPARAPHSFHGALSQTASGWGFDLGERFELLDTRKVVMRLDEPKAADTSHELQRRTGRSPSEWIMHTRVEAAKSLLLTTRQPIAAVAEAVGYADVSQLNRMFRQLAGTSPGAWRRANGASSSTN